MYQTFLSEYKLSLKLINTSKVKGKIKFICKTFLKLYLELPT